MTYKVYLSGGAQVALVIVADTVRRLTDNALCSMSGYPGPQAMPMFI